MRYVGPNILQMAAGFKVTATLYLLLGTAAVAEGVRVSPRQRASWQRSTSSLSLSTFSGRRKAGDGLETPAADGAAAGRSGMGMRAFLAKRCVRSDVHNSIPMVQAQRELSQRATLARQQQQQQRQQQQHEGAGPLFGVSPTTTAEAASSSGDAAAPSAVAGSQKKGVAGAQGLAAKGKGVAKKTAQAPTAAKTRKRKGRGRRGRRLEPVARADAVELLRQAVVKYRGAQVSAASPTSSSASPASSSLPPPVASPPPSPSPPYSSTSSYASSTGVVVSSGGAHGGSDGTSSYASISDGVVVIGGGVSSSSSSSNNGGETGKSRLSSSAPKPPASGDGADAGDTRSSTSGTNIDSSVRVEGGSVGSGDDSTAVAAAAVAAEEFTELAARCLGSALPEIALEAHSLYVRAEASGLQPRTTALLPEYPLTADDVDTEGDDDDGHWRRRRDAEVSLLVTAARA
ncbi:unnamed protein product, partial [Ectocarpus sp. 12 AP-2014]